MDINKRILLTGGSGQLGTEIIKLFKNNEIDLYAPTREELDFSNKDQAIKVVNEFKPDVIIHGGSITNVDYCEENPDFALQTNGQSVKYFIDAAKDFSILPHIIYISTDFVFSGIDRSTPYTESDPVDPISIYGKSKLLGETLLVGYPKYSVLRVSWVYGGNNAPFIDWVLDNFNKTDFAVSEENISVPTSSIDIAKIVLNVINKASFGIFHCVNKGSTTRREMAAKIIGVDLDEVKPADNIVNRIAKRPKYSVLDSTKLENTLNIKFPAWDISLKLFLENYKKDSSK